MEKQKHVQTAIIGVLAVAILVMAVGFAFAVQDLTIGGTADLTGYTWDVHFKTGSGTGTYAETANSVTPATPPTVSGTSISSFNVDLEKPGDYYEFTIDVENGGSIEAKLDSITLNMSTTTQNVNVSDYVEYTFWYGNDSFTTIGSPISVSSSNYVLAKSGQSGNTETVKVKVLYKQPTQNSELLTQDLTVSISATLHYVDNGIN